MAVAVEPSTALQGRQGRRGGGKEERTGAGMRRRAGWAGFVRCGPDPGMGKRRCVWHRAQAALHGADYLPPYCAPRPRARREPAWTPPHVPRCSDWTSRPLWARPPASYPADPLRHGPLPPYFEFGAPPAPPVRRLTSASASAMPLSSGSSRAASSHAATASPVRPMLYSIELRTGCALVMRGAAATALSTAASALLGRPRRYSASARPQ